MSTIHSNPRIATLKNPSAPYRGEWSIHSSRPNPNQDFTAFHEIFEADGLAKVVERLTFSSQADLQYFTSYLLSHGWSPDWEAS
jgi:hypothetical protein